MFRCIWKALKHVTMISMGGEVLLFVEVLRLYSLDHTVACPYSAKTVSSKNDMQKRIIGRRLVATVELHFF